MNFGGIGVSCLWVSWKRWLGWLLGGSEDGDGSGLRCQGEIGIYWVVEEEASGREKQT